MRSIPLGEGMFAEVDDHWFEVLSCRVWHRQKSKKEKWYAADSKGNLMHREVMGLKKGDRRQVDHVKSEQTLNNQESNLRICTQEQNQANRGKNLNNVSGYKGVAWNSKRKCFQSVIGVNGKSIWLGRRETAEQCWRELYVPAALKYHGEFARTT